jgi:multiple sugar transport system ATP-binding protein
MASISYIDATGVYEGATTPAVSALSFDVQDGEFMVLVGRASAIASASPCAPPRHTCSTAPPACASIE